ncbi:MAG: hypothetical protein ACM37W_03265 [Actinomycetota bacterium]
MNEQPVLGSISPLIPAGNDFEVAVLSYQQQLGFITFPTAGEP